MFKLLLKCVALLALLIQYIEGFESVIIVTELDALVIDDYEDNNAIRSRAIGSGSTSNTFSGSLTCISNKCCCYTPCKICSLILLAMFSLM